MQAKFSVLLPILFLLLCPRDPGGVVEVNGSSTYTTSLSSHPGKIISSTTTAKPKKVTVMDDEDDYDDEDYKDELDEDLEDDYIIHNPKVEHSTHSHGHGHSHPRKEWVDVECPLKLKGRCHCGHQKDPNDHMRIRVVVNCTNAGYTDADFLRFIPADVEVLIVRGNKIPELPLNVFGVDKQLEFLKELDLAGNGIEVIKGKTFHHVPNVDTLILNWNKIQRDVLIDHPRLFSNFYKLKYLHLTNAFEEGDEEWLLTGLKETFKESNLTKLLKLHLEQNRISRIPDPREFCDLKQLMDLHLGQNSLTDIRIDVSDDPDCLPVLRMVDLSFNKVKEVRPNSGIFELLRHSNQRDELVQVDLYNNPFVCDCGLEPFLSWMRNMSRKDPDRIRHRSSLRCDSGYPSSNKALMLSSVVVTECPPPLRTTNEVINRLSWTLLSLILLSICFIGAALYVARVGIPGFLRGICITNISSPLLSTATGVKYTSVEKEEAAEVAHV